MIWDAIPLIMTSLWCKEAHVGSLPVHKSALQPITPAVPRAVALREHTPACDQCGSSGVRYEPFVNGMNIGEQSDMSGAQKAHKSGPFCRLYVYIL